MMGKRKLAISLKYFIALTFLFLSSFMYSTSATGAIPDPGSKNIQTIIALLPPDFPPTYFREPKEGKPAGLAVDVMNELARRCGLNIEYRFAKPWDEIENMVLDGKGDIIPFRVINEKTDQHFIFTHSLDASPVNYIARTSENNSKEPHAGQTVGIIAGSTGHVILQHRSDLIIKPFSSMQHLLMDLLTGQIDLALTATDNLLNLAEEAGLSDKLRVIEPAAFEIKRAIALCPDNVILRDRLNRAIESFEKSPQQKEIYAKWLGKPKSWWTVKRLIFTFGGSFAVTLLLLFGWRFNEMRRMNKVLQADQAFLQTLIDAIPELIFYKNREGVYLGCNTCFAEKFLGSSKEDIIGRTDFDLVSSRTMAEFFREQDRQAIKAGVAHKNDEWITLADGHDILVETIKIPFRDESGDIAGMIGVSRDITERDKAHKMQEESHKRLQTFLDNLPMMAWIKNRQGRFEMVNESFAEACGRSIAEILGKTDQDVWPAELAEKYRRDDEQVMLERNKKHFEELIDEGTEVRWFQTFKTPLIDKNSNIIGTAGIAQNITGRKQAEDVLKRFQLLVTHSREIILFIRHDDLHILEANNAATKAYGYSRDELLAMTIAQLRAPETLESLSEQIGKADAQGILLETIHRRSDGSTFPVEVSSRGETIGGTRVLISVIRDITERKHTEKIMRLSEERFRKLFEESPIGIAFLDAQRHIFLTNQSYRDLLGYTEQEIREKGQISLLHPDDREIWLAASTQLRTGEIPVLHLENRYIRNDGTVLWADNQGIVLRDNEGKFIHTINWMLDITDRKRAEKALIESEAEYKRLSNEFNVVLEAIPDSLALVSTDLRVIWANNYAIKNAPGMSEYRPGIKCHKLWHMKSEPCPNCSLQKVAATGESCEFVRTQHGLTWEYRLLPVKNDAGQTMNIVRLGRDITETRNLEEQLRQAQKLKAIGRLAGGIAHDFNNILVPIIGYTQMVLEEVKESKQLREDLEQVYKAAYRAKDLVKQILSFSRTNQEEPMTGMDISLIVKEALKLIRASIASTIEIHQQIEKGVAIVDPTQIHQIIINLCTNAAHAMQGKGTLTVSLSRVNLDDIEFKRHPALLHLPPGQYLKLCVADTGLGMDPETIERIFEPYFTTKEVGKGTGLGLAVVHGIVKRHKGEIIVNSEPGKGSVFEVFLPMAQEETSPKITKQNDLPGGSEHILLVDDEKMITDVGIRILEGLGYKITTKNSSTEALDFFRSHAQDFDLVLTDFTMPKLTGIELAKDVLRIRPEIPVIICTGYNEKANAETLKAIGVKELLIKPLERRSLAKIIREVLDKSDASCNTSID